MQYHSKILKIVKVTKENINRLVFFWTPFIQGEYAFMHISLMIIQCQHAFMHSSLIIIQGEHTACIPASLLYRASMRSNFMLIQREHAFKPHNYTGRACIHALILIQNEHTVINIQGGHVFMHSSLIIIRGEHAFMH